MDQNQQNFYQPYVQAPPVQKNAAYYRAKAREALKDKWVMTSLSAFVFMLLLVVAIIVAMLPMMGIMIATVIAHPGDSLPPQAVVGIVVAMLAIYAIIPLIAAPLTVGYCRIHLDVMDGKQADIKTLFLYFKQGYLRTVGLMLQFFLRILGILFAWLIPTFVLTVLASTLTQNAPLSIAIFFVGYIVGIALLMVFSYRYFMSFFILAEYPEMRAIDALRNSRMLMRGNKWRLFCLQLSFIGWELVAALASIITCGMAGMIAPYVLYAYMYTAQAAFYDEIANRAAARETEFPSLNPDDYLPGAEYPNV